MMLHALYLIYHSRFWQFFVFFVAFTWYVMTRRQLSAARYRARVDDGRISYPLTKRDVTTLVTVYREDPDTLRRSLSTMRRNLDVGTRKNSMIVIIDGYDKYPEEGDAAAEIARECGADLVLSTNARKKRLNIEHVVMLADKMGILYDDLAILDSDTVCKHDQVMLHLAAPLNDPTIGIVTSSQRILDVGDHPPKIIANWLEFAREHSSMSAAGKKNAIGCAPGRLIIMRTALIKEALLNRELSEDDMNLFGFVIRWVAGDDRFLTMLVQKQGMGSTIALKAEVETGAPETFLEIFSQWIRWGRSSQWYTFRFIAWLITHTWANWGADKKTTIGHFFVWSTRFLSYWLLKEPKPFDRKKWWMWVNPLFWPRTRRASSLERRVFQQHSFVIQHYLSDIAITLGTVAVVLLWIYNAIFGNQEIYWVQAIILAAVSICLTVVVRQFRYLWENPRHWYLVPLFAVVMAIGQFIRVYSLLTPFLAGRWGTRAGADQEDDPIIWVREHGKMENLIEYHRT